MANTITEWPSITIAIPTFNEENMIQKCLDSIFSQDYPSKKIKVIIVDDNSTDNTIGIVKKYPVQIKYNGKKDAEYGKMIAFKSSQSELFIYLDADIQLIGKLWLKQMINPLIEDKSITATFTKFVGFESDNSLQKYYSLNPLQIDPIFQFFSPKIADKVTIHRKNYDLCEFQLFSIPPIGICINRTSVINRFLIHEDKYMELDLMAKLVESGFTKYAYVPSAGIYHDSFRTLGDLISKRLRNIGNVYLTDVKSRKYTWFNLRNKRDLIKIILWVLYANSIVFPIIKSLYVSCKNRSRVGLWEAIVTPIITDAIILGFIKDVRGWKMILRGLT
jgi:glycosyltransferase involved in cell wall biosynthesis